MSLVLKGLGIKGIHEPRPESTIRLSGVAACRISALNRGGTKMAHACFMATEQGKSGGKYEGSFHSWILVVNLGDAHLRKLLLHQGFRV